MLLVVQQLLQQIPSPITLQLTPLVSLVSGSKVMDKVLQQTVSSALVAVALLFSTNSKTVPSTN
jgi:predicted membrane-bound dolichyl-phosphate-mannose-protein mannosyltransferase